MVLSKAKRSRGLIYSPKSSIPGLSITISGDVATATHAIVGKILAKHDIITISALRARILTLTGTGLLLERQLFWASALMFQICMGRLPHHSWQQRSPEISNGHYTGSDPNQDSNGRYTHRRPQVPMLVPAWRLSLQLHHFLGHLQVMILDIIHRKHLVTNITEYGAMVC